MHFPVTSPFQIISSYSRPSSKEMHSSIPPSHIHGMLHHCAMLSWELPKLQAPSWSSRRGQQWAKSLPHCNAVTKNVAGREIILKQTSTVRRNLCIQSALCIQEENTEHLKNGTVCMLYWVGMTKIKNDLREWKVLNIYAMLWIIPAFFHTSHLCTTC